MATVAWFKTPAIRVTVLAPWAPEGEGWGPAAGFASREAGGLARGGGC